MIITPRIVVNFLENAEFVIGILIICWRIFLLCKNMKSHIFCGIYSYLNNCINCNGSISNNNDDYDNNDNGNKNERENEVNTWKFLNESIKWKKAELYCKLISYHQQRSQISNAFSNTIEIETKFFRNTKDKFYDYNKKFIVMDQHWAVLHKAKYVHKGGAIQWYLETSYLLQLWLSCANKTITLLSEHFETRFWKILFGILSLIRFGKQKW